VVVTKDWRAGQHTVVRWQAKAEGGNWRRRVCDMNMCQQPALPTLGFALR
jgi:hypothetical protein